MTQPSQPIPDVIKALVAHLKEDVPTNTAASGRIFGAELPRGETANMPRASIVLRSAGGPSNRGTLTLEDLRIDMRCYGATAFEANRLYRTAYTALRFGQRIVQGDTLVHSATPESGPISLREPELEWPFELSSWRVKLALVGVA